MAKIEFLLPDVGEGLEEGEIVSWLVAPGDRVSRDQPLVEVQTDKALVELPSPVAGRIVSLAFSAGQIVKVGQVLVVLEDGHGGDAAPAGPAEAPTVRRVSTPGVPAPAGPYVDFPDIEDLTPTAPPAPVASEAATTRGTFATPAPDTTSATIATPAAPARTPAGLSSPTPAPVPDSADPRSAAGPGPAAAGRAGRPKAAPTVRKLALDRGIDLATITGSGPGGRILATDIEAAAAQTASPTPATTQATGVPEFHPPEPRNAASTAAGGAVASGGLGWMAVGRHPLRRIRRVTAEAMGRSWSEIPHLTTMDEIDATGLLAARRRLADAGIDTTIGALLVAGVARGLRRYPVLNASLELTPSDATIRPGPAQPDDTPPGPSSEAGAAGGTPGQPGGGTIVIHPDCNIGLAVATADGLIVPVIRQADRRTLQDLAAEARRLSEAARNRRVEINDLRGGTFTISNYGALGGRFATPLIRPPEVGIMGFGAIRNRPFVVDGEVKARPTLPWSLSADHRLIDGDVATAFAEYVTGLLADPVALLAELLGAGT